MKAWNKPEITSIDINETKWGIFDTEYESMILLNDSKKTTQPDDYNDDPCSCRS